MPRLRQNAERDAMKNFQAEINAQCARYGYKTQQAFGELLGVSQPTAGKYLQNPACIQICVLRTIIKKLKLNPVIVLRMLGYTSHDIRQIREDAS